jgi:8-oxo-dGTP pyrophosphatase MutT (NUDIX family)
MPAELPNYIELSRERLKEYEPRPLHVPGAMPAAVLLALVHHSGADRVILTVRTNTVEHHKGQISFPGGAVHAADKDLSTTALRETWEEVGVDPDGVEIIGRLDDILTISNFVVSPFVGVLPHGQPEYITSPIEVAEVIEPPVAHLLDPQNLVWEERAVEDRVVRLPAYLFDGHRIWGATARMLHEFLCLVSNDITALSHARGHRRT